MGLGFHFGFERGGRFNDGWVENPPRERVRDGLGDLVGALHHCDADGNHPRFVGILRLDEIYPLARIVEWGRADRGRLVDACRQRIELGFAIELRRRQIARAGSTPRADADQFADDRKRSAEDCDCENHFQERQATAAKQASALHG